MSEDKKRCLHPEFDPEVRIGRLYRGDDQTGMPDDFLMHVKVVCRECKMPFCFLGVKEGISFGKPSVSVEWTELRAPISPQDVTVTPMDQFASAVRKGSGNLH